VAVVPGEAQQPCLTSLIAFQPVREFQQRALSAFGDGFKNVTGRGKTGFNAEVARMDGALHDTTHSGDEAYLPGDSHNAGRSSDHVNHVTLTHTRSNRIPVGVDSAYGHRNAGSEPQFCSPVGGEFASKLIGGSIVAIQFLTDTLKEGIDFDKKVLCAEATE